MSIDFASVCALLSGRGVGVTDLKEVEVDNPLLEQLDSSQWI
jgi:hypothetical protein